MEVTESSVQANHGASVPDTSASQEQMSQGDWLQSRGIKAEDRVELARLSHMRYQHPDLDVLSGFMLGLCHVVARCVEYKLTLIDFGMAIAKRTENEVWFRGYGIDQYVYYATKGPKKFLGGVFAVESKEEFEK